VNDDATFADDLDFLRTHTEVIVLSQECSQARVAIVPAWQGRVMTSTVGPGSGPSFGWINRALISSGKVQEHINAFGGEDRLWLGPEGGQFSIFFDRGAPFDFAYWSVPASLDTLPFRVAGRSSDWARFEADISLVNYCGTRFDVVVDRELRLLEPACAWRELGMAPSERIALVGYRSTNVLINAGQAAWSKETGLLCVWVLGMFPPGDATTIAVPIRRGPESELGPRVNSDYFGAIPADRLKVTEGSVFLSGDGRFRCKLGINPRRSLGKLGSYDARRKILTIVRFSQPEGVNQYADSRWKIHEDPYAGDAINAYNDGPTSPGSDPMGPFFEMESSSPAVALQPGDRIEHIHRTFHLMGPEDILDAVSREVLGLPLAEVISALDATDPGLEEQRSAM
jgi:hypothetical protein